MLRLVLLSLLLAGCLAGCLAPAGRPSPVTLHDQTLTADTVWSGELLIDGRVKVAGGATLTIAPGTVISFVRRDSDQDGLGDAGIEVERGALLAVGTPLEPITFRSAEATPQPGDWLELKVDFARQLELRWCVIRDSAHGLHAHFSNGILSDSVLRDNIDGTRFGQGRFTVRNNLILNNQGKGVNFRNSQIEISDNIFQGNRAGIFIFENDRELTIRGNNFIGNQHHVRLGDFFTGDVALGPNWFDARELAPLLYDQGEDPTIGSLTAEPVSAWFPAAGPRDALALKPFWSFAGSSFFDADPVTYAAILYLPGWDGGLYALTRSGDLLWRAELGEVADATVAVDEARVYVQTWQRRVLALDRTTGQELWRFDYPESPHDDHRQGGVVRLDDLLLVPAWNGQLYALDATTGELRWQHDCGAPLRCAPVPAAEGIYQASGSGRLTLLDPLGRELWRQELQAPLLSRPVVTEGGAMAVNKQGVVVALDPFGKERWRLDSGETCFYGGLVIEDDILFLATAANGLHAIDPDTGQLLWRVDVGAPVYATPLVAGGRIFVADNLGRMQIFNAGNGRLLAGYTAAGAIQGRPLLDGWLLILASRGGQIEGLQLEPATP